MPEQHFIYREDRFGPLINALIFGAAALAGQWAWNKLPNAPKLLRLAASTVSGLSCAAAAYAVKGLF